MRSDRPRICLDDLNKQWTDRPASPIEEGYNWRSALYGTFSPQSCDSGFESWQA
jgi:hypothetical protein